MFKGKVVIVTGSSSGIGEAIAVKFSQNGASVTICGRDETRLTNVLKKCRDASGGHEERFITVLGDVTEAATREKILQETLDEFGRLDILVPNAGIMLQTHIETDTEEQYDQILNTNLKAAYFLIQKALPSLQKSKGNIVCVSSLMSTMASEYVELYQISKAALDQLVRAVSVSQAPKGVRVNAINPTYVKTRLASSNEYVVNYLDETFAKKHPLGGRASTVEEQADAVFFLASDAATFVTGQCLKVDGGLSHASSI